MELENNHQDWLNLESQVLEKRLGKVQTNERICCNKKPCPRKRTCYHAIVIWSILIDIILIISFATNPIILFKVVR